MAAFIEVESADYQNVPLTSMLQIRNHEAFASRFMFQSIAKTVFWHSLKHKTTPRAWFLECCGVGGIRTRVQTSNSNAFYTFSLSLIFDWQLT